MQNVRVENAVFVTRPIRDGFIRTFQGVFSIILNIRMNLLALFTLYIV